MSASKGTRGGILGHPARIGLATSLECRHHHLDWPCGAAGDRVSPLIDLRGKLLPFLGDERDGARRQRSVLENHLASNVALAATTTRQSREDEQQSGQADGEKSLS